jgi:long-subunit acyl-CoA synthetase (AMP-forming)
MHLEEEYVAPSVLVRRVGSCESVAEALSKALVYYTNRPCLGHRPLSRGSTWAAPTFEEKFEWMTYAEVANASFLMGAGLRTFFPDAQHRPHVALCMLTCRPEWFLADFACVLSSCVVVPSE